MGKKRFFAILVLILTNIVWLIWAISNSVFSMIVLSLSFIFLNIKTLLEWFGQEKTKSIENQDEKYKRLKRILGKWL